VEVIVGVEAMGGSKAGRPAGLLQATRDRIMNRTRAVFLCFFMGYSVAQEIVNGEEGIRK